MEDAHTAVPMDTFRNLWGMYLEMWNADLDKRYIVFHAVDREMHLTVTSQSDCYFFLLCIWDKNLILKIILKCISQQETWYFCQKSQDPSSGATSNKSVKCPRHAVPWFHIKPQLILILGLPETEKLERGFSRDFKTQQMTLATEKQFFLLREQVPEG